MRYLLCILLLLPLLCLAQLPEPKKNTYVNDYTNQLSPEEIHKLDEQLNQLEKTTGVQMAVLLINELPGQMSIEDYAREVGNKWKVGIDHNGLVYVAVLEERLQRLEVAGKLEGDIPDIVAEEFISSLRPFLRLQQYYPAIHYLVEQIQAHLTGRQSDPAAPDTSQQLIAPVVDENKEDARISEWKTEREEFESRKKYYDRNGNIVIGGIVLLFIGLTVWAWRYKKQYVARNTFNGVYMGVGTAYYASMYPESDNGGSSDLDYTDSGFGDFGGSGGGDFSGGGASGSW